MKLQEVIDELLKIKEKAGGDVYVEVDHRDFNTTLGIQEIYLGETYTGPRTPIVYIYVDNHDAEGLLAVVT